MENKSEGDDYSAKFNKLLEQRNKLKKANKGQHELIVKMKEGLKKMRNKIVQQEQMLALNSFNAK
jgi:hypothetical protein